ncbi:hypothetical protein L6452_28256 [Arctium lappa]|uniref:Uncharacterized protein n=1 Tax=Arctium lappa TaxID=4217 RepID=A0ACB8ZWY7_ARCLA|nr:hypothetical protein L6452_28256 [Arctium lappa]
MQSTEQRMADIRDFGCYDSGTRCFINTAFSAARFHAFPFPNFRLPQHSNTERDSHSLFATKFSIISCISRFANRSINWPSDHSCH